MKICFFPTLNAPICFWRVESYAQSIVKNNKDIICHVEYLADPNTNVDWGMLLFNYGEKSQEMQTKLYSAFKFFDCLIFQRIQNVEAIALIDKFKKRFPNVKVITEIDDCIGEVSIDSTLPWRDHHRWACEQISRSDAVITSTEYLRDSIDFIVKDKIPVHVAPNCVNSDIWNPKVDIKLNKKKRIGYVGGASHDEDFRIVYRGLKPHLDSDRFKLVIRSGGFRPIWLKEHKNIDFDHVNWHISEFPQKLANLNLDIGVAPLRDCEFNRCKSNIKYLEMASVGVPLVASDVEPYRGEPLIALSENDPKLFAQAIFDRIEQYRGKKILFEDHLIRYDIKKQAYNLIGFLKSI
jgi:glycosyltransferase involved in cell wall biosynthesis